MLEDDMIDMLRTIHSLVEASAETDTSTTGCGVLCRMCRSIFLAIIRKSMSIITAKLGFLDQNALTFLASEKPQKFVRVSYGKVEICEALHTFHLFLIKCERIQASPRGPEKLGQFDLDISLLDQTALTFSEALFLKKKPKFGDFCLKNGVYFFEKGLLGKLGHFDLEMPKNS